MIAGLVTLPFGVPLLPVDTFIRYSETLAVRPRTVKTERDAHRRVAAALCAICSAGRAWLRPWLAFITGCRRRSSAGCAILAGNYGEAGRDRLLRPGAWACPKRSAGTIIIFCGVRETTPASA